MRKLIVTNTPIFSQGITKQAKRCTRRVKLDKVETGEDFQRFCHQHGKDILTQKGFFNKRGVWIEFDCGLSVLIVCF